ncbi:hypothetical protein COT99_03810 [Candidatus Falkowbacteria bacterium CG10_big_fil_rev_8_21_14_0_10_43_10]|uniref:Uncharacterized protein n=1 Tax=Candidatus Falkowbacteria bacterium CG10_big_fil_rev_8_21_14_0_10_43_10 TaxID=1974567 RepID=A0A2H0V1C5_9BACT|nr:MAG: hypothetical protein COT99_03810 [Candidatus Falkowbacteria bacterium CG10_big_fil_rev_8_21_14_0_10_43_10]
MIFFIAIFVLQLIALIFLFLSPNEAGAVEFTPQVEIPSAESGYSGTVPSDISMIAKYIKAVYQYGIGIVGIVAAVVMMFGGVLWLTAGGDSGRVSEAKEWIKASLFGLILALLSYTILLTVNPDLVSFQPITVEQIKSTGSENSADASNQNTSQNIIKRTEAIVSIDTDCNNYYKDKIAQYMKLAKNGKKITMQVSEYDPGALLNGSTIDETGFKTAPTKKICVFKTVENAAK